MHRDAPAVGDHAKFAERLFHPAQFFAQRFEGAENLFRGDLVLAQLDQGLEGDQVGEGIGGRRRNQALALPTSQLPLGEPELAADVRARIFLLRGHANILTGSSKKAGIFTLFVRWRLADSLRLLYFEKYLKGRPSPRYDPE